VIGDSADLKRSSAFTANDSTEVVPKAEFQVGSDRRCSMLGTENKMVVETGIRLRHGCFSK
jgi:hypothetical protein